MASLCHDRIKMSIYDTVVIGDTPIRRRTWWMRTGSSRRTTARITTISEALALPQAMCPGNAFTSHTRWVLFILTAVLQTPLPTPIRVQAGRLRLETWSHLGDSIIARDPIWRRP